MNVAGRQQGGVEGREQIRYKAGGADVHVCWVGTELENKIWCWRSLLVGDPKSVNSRLSFLC